MKINILRLLISLSIAFYVGFFPSSCAKAQEKVVEVAGDKVLNLEECIKTGLANYQSIKVAEFDKIWAEAKLKEAKTARYLPQFNMTNLFGPIPDVPAGFGPADNFPRFETDWSEWSIFYRLKIDAIQPLYTFGKLSNLVEAATKGVTAKDLQIEIEKRDLIHKIKGVYFGLVFGYSALDLMDEVADKIESAKKRVTRLLKKHSPEVTELDLLKLKVFDADLKKRYIDVHSDIDTGKRALLVLLGKGPNHGIDVKDKTFRPLPVDVKQIDEYYKIAKENRAELKQMQAAIDIKKAMMKVAKSDFFPTLFLGGQFEYGIAPGREHYDNPYLYERFNTLVGGAAIGLNQNLNFALTSTRFKQAKAEYNKLLMQNDLVTNAVFLEIRDSFQDLVSNREAIDVTKNGFKDARSWMTASYLDFDMGTLSTKDLIDAFFAYTKTKMEYFNTIFSFNSALSRLSRATGTELAGISY